MVAGWNIHLDAGRAGRAGHAPGKRTLHVRPLPFVMGDCSPSTVNVFLRLRYDDEKGQVTRGNFRGMGGGHTPMV